MDATPPTTPPPKKFPLLLVIVLVAGLASAAFNLVLSDKLGQAQEQNAQLLIQLAVASRQPSAEPLMVEAKALRDKVAELESALGALGVPEYATVQKPVSAPAQDPSAHDSIAAQQQKSVEMIYGELFRHFALSPEDHDRLEKLLVEKQMNQVNFGLKMMDPSLSAEDRSTVAQQLQAANAETDAEVRDFFNNDSSYAYYQTYIQQQPERMEVNTLTASLAAADLPLEPAQAEALVNLMYQERSNFKFTQDFYDQTKIDPQSLNGSAADIFLQEQALLQDQIADRAASLLTPQQMTIFRENQANVRQLTQANLSMARQLAGNP